MLRTVKSNLGYSLNSIKLKTISVILSPTVCIGTDIRLIVGIAGNLAQNPFTSALWYQILNAFVSASFAFFCNLLALYCIKRNVPSLLLHQC